MNNVTFQKFHFANYKHNLVVTDDKVANLYHIVGDNVYLLPQGERAKSFEHVEALCKWFLSKRLAPNDTVVAVGGGSVGDAVGFATSIYKRGVNVLHVPTTLIAQIDSSIGGKTAINLDGIKNAVGTFHFGDTLIDFDFLNTLDDVQMASGWGEILKYVMIDEHVRLAYDDGKGALKDIICACVNCKQHLCHLDPFDKDARRVLNFGHTVGHAMELAYDIPHGKAVANGIYYETLMAAKLEICDKAYADKWTGVISRNFTIYPLTKEILALALQDKKNACGKVCFVLPDVFNQTYLTLDEIEELLLNV